VQIGVVSPPGPQPYIGQVADSDIPDSSLNAVESRNSIPHCLKKILVFSISKRTEFLSLQCLFVSASVLEIAKELPHLEGCESNG
jgi:hypothetical protein